MLSQGINPELSHDVMNMPPDDDAAALIPEKLRASARELAGNLLWMPNVRSSKVFANRCRTLAERLATTLHRARDRRSSSPSLRTLRESSALLESSFGDVYEALYRLQRMPHARRSDGTVLPRVLAIAEEALRTARYRCDDEVFSSYVDAFQQITVLNMAELWVLISAMKLVLLERLVEKSSLAEKSDRQKEVAVFLESLRTMNQVAWRQVVEPLITFDRILQQDPAGAYNQMGPESRDLYRNEVANVAEHSALSEQEVAVAALELAQKAQRSPHSDPRLAKRLSHVGYYLVAEGADALRRKADFRPAFKQRLKIHLKAHPDDFYIPAIGFLTTIIALTVIDLSRFDYWSFGTFFFMLLVLVLPCSQAAVEIANYMVLSFLTPQILPKLDFSRGVPDSCATLVTIPTLLLNEHQVRKVVDDLEVRALGNEDRNLHFAVLTDLPDSPTPPGETDHLALLCARLIERLNEKYGGNGAGSFFLFHREHRYNPRERAWMGWERKRGKLLELNRFLRGEGEYSKKVGDLSILPNIRFVISLDADTLLPRGTAHRMIGTLAHPLNQAIIDPERNVVVAGYGILQPRVGVSIRSAARSRLAKIWSGQAGLDIYTRAVSDVYQDLYGEGTYVGKGIYEVDVLHRVLDGRFPSNLLLSHDLIEGAYSRSGLVSDIEIIEDYPSVYSAYNRRKHRWLRGDWQIAEWLLAHVPGPHGERVENPISFVSKWKIFDNLRRSLVEPAIFLLFVLGWLVLPGSPGYWTLATVCLLFLPNALRLLFRLARAAVGRNPVLLRTLQEGLFAANLSVVLTLIFLAHQMLLSLDAMVRALIRRVVTGERLLEWVTAAQEEHDPHRRTPLDIYLDLTPLLALGLGLLVWFLRPRAIFAAAPILLLWGSSRLISVTLNLPARSRYKESPGERVLLRRIALRTWRFFAEFSRSDNNWLIPDNVRESPLTVDLRLSPTNLGFLLNARQVACQLGYLTLPEFVELTEKTLATAARLTRSRGHFFNWYDGKTGDPLRPMILSSVDSGNLVASLWALEQGCLAELRKPLVDSHLAEGLADYLRESVRAGLLRRRVFSSFVRRSRSDWLDATEAFRVGTLSPKSARGRSKGDSQWFMEQSALRVESISYLLRSYVPWLLAEFEPLRQALPESGFRNWRDIELERIPEFTDALQLQLASISLPSSEENRLRQQLQRLLPVARNNAVKLIRDLTTIAAEAGRLAGETDFGLFLNPHRRLMAIAFDAETQGLSPECYDQLASESRVATFIAIAKNDVPQETWFGLVRHHKEVNGRIVLLSWAGTMFEYLMPCLWMHTYPDTLLDRACIEAVRAQRSYALDRGVPWGISESASSEKLDDGSYKYYAFGVPELALRDSHPKSLVISPYSTLLAQHISSRETLRNLRRMERAGWLGTYGMYEAADFTKQNGGRRRRPEIVRLWMAHHQGMSLLAIGNWLCDGVVRRWFHCNPLVQATELLLQERPAARLNLLSGRPRLAA
jgi:cyclic beta-1,2-glucan synthetase